MYVYKTHSLSELKCVPKAIILSVSLWSTCEYISIIIICLLKSHIGSSQNLDSVHLPLMSVLANLYHAGSGSVFCKNICS